MKSISNRMQNITSSMRNAVNSPRRTSSSMYQPLYGKLPKIDIDTSAYSASQRGAPKTSFSKYLSDTINRIGGTLRPSTPVTQQLSFEDYASPQRAVFDQFVGQNLRPEFERFQRNPFERQYANVSAASNRMYAGNAPRTYLDSQRQIEMGYGDQLEQMKSGYDQMIRDLYNKRISRMGDSATQMANI